MSKNSMAGKIHGAAFVESQGSPGGTPGSPKKGDRAGYARGDKLSAALLATCCTGLYFSPLPTLRLGKDIAILGY